MGYLLLSISILLMSLKFDEKIKILIVVVSLAVVSSIRFGIGADYFNYEFLYYASPSSAFLDVMRNTTLNSIEPGFRLLIALSRSLNFSYFLFVSFISILMIYMVTRWILDNSIERLQSFIVYISFFLIVWNFSALRQGLAISIGCYYLYNQRFNFSFIQRIFIVLGLSMLHISALFYLVHIALNLIHWNRKKLTIFLVFGLILSMISYGDIVNVFNSIEFLKKFTVYFAQQGAGVGFWDFKGLARLVFAVTALIAYPYTDQSTWIKKTTLNDYILGLSLFFYLRFSDLVAARLSVYGFFLAILILPSIIHGLLENFKKERLKRVMIYIVFVCVCLLYYTKDLGSLYTQAYMVSGSPYLSFSTIFERETFLFNHPYYYPQNYSAIDQTESAEMDFQKFILAQRDHTELSSDYPNYLPVKFPNGLYGLIDSKGMIVIDGLFESLDYVDGILRIGENEYLDLELNRLTIVEGAERFMLKQREVNNYIADNFHWAVKLPQRFGESILNQFERNNGLHFSWMYKPLFDAGVKIGVYRYYPETYVYRIYDKEINEVSSYFFTSFAVINKSGVLRFENDESTQYFDRFGKCIWFEYRVKGE
ncbi:MAG: EpsG family protein [Erysipelotrichaceae bacterium]